MQGGDRNRGRDHQQRQSSLGNLAVTKNAGLKGLGGARSMSCSPTIRQPRYRPEPGTRLITEEKVVALTGPISPGITLTASAIAEKYGIPFVNGERFGQSPERVSNGSFRTTPVAEISPESISTPQGDEGRRTEGRQHRPGHEIEYGTSVANSSPAVQEKARHRPGHRVFGQHHRRAEPGAALKDKKPDVVIMISYTSDAILYARRFRR